MGVRLRTTLMATATVAAALCLAAVALFVALDASLATSTKKLAALDAKKQAVHLLYSDRPGEPGEPGEPGGTGAFVGSKEIPGEVGPEDQKKPPDPAGGGPAPTGEPGVTPQELAASKVQDSKAGKVNRAGKIEVIKVFETQDGPVVVKGTASTAPARAALGTLKRLLLPGVPALLALVALATWLAVGRALRPVSAIRAKVADITAYDLHEHVPVPDTRDEIAAIARTVNATLDRLRTAVEAHRQFVADAAHELRSPMAILRTRLELARPTEQRLAAGALDDVERLQSLTADLLLLARLDAREPLRARELDLAQVVAEEAARTRPRADVRVILDLAPDLLVNGSHDQLRRLVANLVDNAVRHAGGTVGVTLKAVAGQAVLDVADDGPGIPAQHHGTVFDRFARLDHARARDTGGSGLGLPIARDIARAHEGTLGVVPGGKGARLRAVLPLAGDVEGVGDGGAAGRAGRAGAGATGVHEMAVSADILDN